MGFWKDVAEGKRMLWLQDGVAVMVAVIVFIILAVGFLYILTN